MIIPLKYSSKLSMRGWFPRKCFIQSDFSTDYCPHRSTWGLYSDIFDILETFDITRKHHLKTFDIFAIPRRIISRCNIAGPRYMMEIEICIARRAAPSTESRRINKTPERFAQYGYRWVNEDTWVVKSRRCIKQHAMTTKLSYFALKSPDDNILIRKFPTAAKWTINGAKYRCMVSTVYRSLQSWYIYARML